VLPFLVVQRLEIAQRRDPYGNQADEKERNDDRGNFGEERRLANQPLPEGGRTSKPVPVRKPVEGDPSSGVQ
jgi:hypothetical protein